MISAQWGNRDTGPNWFNNGNIAAAWAFDSGSKPVTVAGDAIDFGGVSIRDGHCGARFPPGAYASVTITVGDGPAYSYAASTDGANWLSPPGGTHANTMNCGWPHKSPLCVPDKWPDR